MSEAAPEQSPRPAARTRQFRVLVGGAALVVLGLILWLALRDTGSSNSTPHASNVTGVSVAQLQTLARSVAHPVFWLGPKRGSTYELTRAGNGSIFIRYLPHGAKLGSSKPYLSVATYPFAGAYAALQNVAAHSGSTPVNVAHHGLAVLSDTYPKSVHVAYPGVDYQAEVFDPTPGVALGLVASGKLRALGSLAPKQTAPSGQPAAASPAALASLARSLGHPVYWLGPKPGTTYELSRGPSGQVYIRYLPAGVRPGTSTAYLAVATYPFAGAFAAIHALARQKGAQSIRLPAGGLAVVDPRDTKSIHLAYPGGNVEVEVFDPSPSVVRQLVSSGQVRAIG